MNDSVLALDIVDKALREDLEEMKEEMKESNFIISVVDDSETVSIFDTEQR